MFNTILFPTDGSPLSDKAAETALAFAQLNKAKLVAISVVQPFPFSPMADGGIVLDASLYEQQMNESAQRAVEKIGEAARDALAGAGVEERERRADEQQQDRDRPEEALDDAARQ